MGDPARGRRRGTSAKPLGRHRSADEAASFSATFRALGELGYAGARVAAHIVDLDSGTVLSSIDDQVALPAAGLGKLLLLIDVSARMTARESSGLGIVDKPAADAVLGPGLWQRLQVPALPVADLALLVASVDDSLATNELLRRVGLDAVRERAESLGLSRTALLDIERDHRGPDDAPQLSVGSAAELAGLMRSLGRVAVVDEVSSRRVLDWLSRNADLSLVASAFGLDPLSHPDADHGILLANKTGSAPGVRAEAGIVRGPRAAVAYAVLIEFDDSALGTRMAALEGMRAVGYDIVDYIH